MRLYHARLKHLIIILFMLSITACNAPQISQGQVSITIVADGRTHTAQVPAGSTIQDALAVAGVLVNALDRSEPPLYTIVTDGVKVQLTRVTEEFTQPVEEVIPFERQEVRSESLPEGQMLISQKGVNGLRRITHRRLYEEGIQISEEEWEEEIIQKPVPEIVVVGIGQTFTPIDIPGRIAYLMGGNAWVMDTNTGIRRLVVKSADLDGYVFSLSPDGRWLLFTRRSQQPEEINNLWIARVDELANENDEAVELDIANIIHFGDFRPQYERDELISYYTIGYSTVEQRTTAPGWQANNDLAYLGTNPATAYISDPIGVIESNSGGVYGWWGTCFSWRPDGNYLAYASPDAIGLIELEEGKMNPIQSITPLETGSDWAWVPGITWSPDGQVLYTVIHNVEAGSSSPDRSPLFDLVAIPLNSTSREDEADEQDKVTLSGSTIVPLVQKVGMFAYPSPSPLQPSNEDENGYQIAYLQAISPRESQSSLYRLVVMDRDGSNQRDLFPAPDARGLEPRQVIWSPEPLEDDNSYAILVIYQGNLWLVNTINGEGHQLTSDGLATRADWK